MNGPKNARELKSFLTDCDGNVDQDKQKVFVEECQSGRHGLSRYAIKDLAESFGYDHRPDHQKPVNVLEAGGIATHSTAFVNITGQLLFSEVREHFDREANVFSPLVPVVPSIIKGTEIVPQVKRLDPDDMEAVLEGQAYPRLGLSENYYTLPAKVKRGGIIELTREAVHLDKTGTLVQQAQEMGQVLGEVKENDVIDCLIGQTQNYIRNGSSSNTFLTTGAYINNQSSMVLSDWTDVEQALLLFAGILDPDTSEPLSFQPKHLIVNPAKLMTARRIVSATGTRHDSDHAEPLNEQLFGHNPLGTMGLQVLSSVRLYRRILAGPEPTAAVAAAGWFLGDISKMLRYYEVFPLTLMQKGSESEASFDRDIAAQFKASYFGATAVREPRFMIRSEDTAW